MRPLFAWLAACALTAGCSDVDPDAPCRAGFTTFATGFDFGFVGQETRVVLPIAIRQTCRTPTVTVRVTSPQGDARTPSRVEVLGGSIGFSAAVDFVADAEGPWIVEASFSGSLGRVQREVAIVGDLRGAALDPFPNASLGSSCATPLLTAGGSGLCFGFGSVRWPDAQGEQSARASSLWVEGERVWLAREGVVVGLDAGIMPAEEPRREAPTLFVLSATGDGGFALGPPVDLPDAGEVLSVSATGQRAVVAQRQATTFFTLDDAGTARRSRVDPRGGEVVALSGTGPGAVLVRTENFIKSVCQLDAAPGERGCQPLSSQSTSTWRAPQGLWLRDSMTGTFTFQVVDPRVPTASLLSGPRVTVGLIGEPLGESGTPMTMLAFSAPDPSGAETPLVLLPRLREDTIHYEVVRLRRGPGLEFHHATATHVFYRDTRGGGMRWVFIRRGAP